MSHFSSVFFCSVYGGSFWCELRPRVSLRRQGRGVWRPERSLHVRLRPPLDRHRVSRSVEGQAQRSKLKGQNLCGKDSMCSLPKPNPLCQNNMKNKWEFPSCTKGMESFLLSLTNFRGSDFVQWSCVITNSAMYKKNCYSPSPCKINISLFLAYQKTCVTVIPLSCLLNFI